MTTYYWTMGLVIVFSFLAELFWSKPRLDGSIPEKTPMTTKVFLFLSAAVMIFIAGSRYYVGSDFGGYYRGLRTYAPRLGEALRTFDEPGLPLIASIVKLFTNDGAWLIMTCSVLTIGLFLIVCYKNERSYLMASLLFFFTIWDGTFNGVRQYLASAVLFCGHRCIYDKKFIKWLITVLLATAVHSSAIVMVTLYFLLRNKVRIRNILLLAVGTYIVSANYDVIFSFLGFADESELTSYAARSVNVLRIMVACAPAVMCLFVNLKKEMTAEDTFYTNAMVVHGAAMIAASNSAYLARIGIYTGPFVVVALPKMLRTENKYVEMLMRVGTLVLYGIFWYVEVSGSPDLNNFRFVWFK